MSHGFESAGYDPSVFDLRIESSGGPEGQPVFILRWPITFREVATLGRTVHFSHFATWMGRTRELASWPMRQALYPDLREGHALLTNGSSLQFLGEVGELDVVEVRFSNGIPYGRAGSSVDFSYAWIAKDPSGRQVRAARGKMGVTWARITGHGTVEPIPFPAYMQNLVGMMSKVQVGNGQERHFFDEPLDEPLSQVEKGKLLFEAPPGPRGPRPLFEKIFETSLEQSNVVGNVYFANYYAWQGRVVDHWFYRADPTPYRYGAAGMSEPICVEASVHHLRESMPFDRVGVTMALRTLHERAASLYIEYFRLDDKGGRQKLAYGDHQIVCMDRSVRAQATPVARTTAWSEPVRRAFDEGIRGP